MILAIVSSLVINLSPVALGVLVYLAGEGVGKALLAAILLYVWYGLFMALWPILAAISFVGAWMEYGFLPALGTTLVSTLATLTLLSLPEWFLAAAYRAAMQVPDRRSWDSGR